MEGDLISIIIPIYNAEKYLDSCMRSVSAQTYGNLEIILIDDGSTDLSKEMCDKYAQSDSRIKVIHKSNGGVSAARNDGLNAAKGDYICFIDADDIVSKNYVSYLYKLLIEHRADVSICDFTRITIYEIDNKMNLLDKGGYQELEYNRLDALKDLMYKRNLTGYSYVKMFKRSVISKVRFNASLQVAEDFDFIFRVFQNCEKIVFSNRIMYLYVQNPDSCMHSPNWKKYEKTWQYQWKQLDEIVNSYPELRDSFETYLLVGGLAFYAHSQKWKDCKPFTDRIINNISLISKDVANNKEGKHLYRIMGRMCCISAKATCYLMKMIVSFQLLFGIQLAKPV